MNPFSKLENFITQHIEIHKAKFLDEIFSKYPHFFRKFQKELESGEKDPFDIGEVTAHFNAWLKLNLGRQLSLSNEILNNSVFKLTADNKNVEQYLSYATAKYVNILETAYRAYSDYPFIINYLETFRKKYLEKFHAINISDFSTRDSFHFDFSNTEDKLESLNLLYTLLTNNPPLIMCSKDEFIRAFSNGKISDGIKIKTSVPSILYLIDELTANHFLTNFDGKDYNSKFNYIFRNADGQHIRNLKHLKSQYRTGRNKPRTAERIDEIIKQLLDNI